MLPALAASLVRLIELVLLPKIEVGGNKSPSRLNKPSLSSGISGIAYIAVTTFSDFPCLNCSHLNNNVDII